MSTTDTTTPPETTPLRCKRCRDEDGPFTADGLCENCNRPMPLEDVA